MKKPLILLMILLALILAAAPALAMTEQRAGELVKAADPRARQARQIWTYPDGEGAWAFYADGWQSPLFQGAFWYVTEDAQYPLGSYTRSVFTWGMLDCDPPVFYSDTLYDGQHHLHAALLQDGAPVEIADFGKLISLHVSYGSLLGLARRDPADAYSEWVFLGVDGARLTEIAARPIDEAQARAIPGMDDILSELMAGDGVNPGGVAVTGFLFRNAAPGQYRNAKGNVQGSVTLSVTRQGAPCRVYVFLDADGTAHAERGWEEEIVIWDGAPAARYDAGLEAVETVTE